MTNSKRAHDDKIGRMWHVSNFSSLYLCALNDSHSGTHKALNYDILH
jgi:hypothetical protein